MQIANSLLHRKKTMRPCRSQQKDKILIAFNFNHIHFRLLYFHSFPFVSFVSIRFHSFPISRRHLIDFFLLHCVCEGAFAKRYSSLKVPLANRFSDFPLVASKFQYVTSTPLIRYTGFWQKVKAGVRPANRPQRCRSPNRWRKAMRFTPAALAV